MRNKGNRILFFLLNAVTSVTLSLREGKIEGTTKYSSIGDKSGFQINVEILFLIGRKS